MRHNISEMRLFAAELRRELSITLEGCRSDVEAIDDGIGTPKIKVMSSSANRDQKVLYCLNEVTEYCKANELICYITVETLRSGAAIPVIIIF